MTLIYKAAKSSCIVKYLLNNFFFIFFFVLCAGKMHYVVIMCRESYDYFKRTVSKFEGFFFIWSPESGGKTGVALHLV